MSRALILQGACPARRTTIAAPGHVYHKGVELSTSTNPLHDACVPSAGHLLPFLMSTASDKRAHTGQSPRIAPSFPADTRHSHVSRYRPALSDSLRLQGASLHLPGSSSYLPGPPTHLPGPSCARTFARPSSFHSLYRDQSHVLHRRRTPCTCGKPATPFKDPGTLIQRTGRRQAHGLGCPQVRAPRRTKVQRRGYCQARVPRQPRFKDPDTVDRGTGRPGSRTSPP